MKELVVVPTFLREALLWLCLEAIRRESPDMPIYVFSDRGARSRDLHFAAANFGVSLTVRPQHGRYGNSWNLLDALCWATKRDVDIVHLIEDDTILHRGYFDWARKALANQTEGTKLVPAAVCGRIASPNIPNWYESPCASWNASHLRSALSHLRPEYLDATTRHEMQRILDEKIFPNSKYKHGGAEQDGFFVRAIEHHRWATLFPPKPLATHLGFTGYNCPPARKGPEGTFEQRISFYRNLLNDRQKRVELFGRTITDKEMEGMNCAPAAS